MPLVMLENIEIGKHIIVVIVVPLISLIIELSYMRAAGASASILPVLPYYQKPTTDDLVKWAHCI